MVIQALAVAGMVWVAAAPPAPSVGRFLRPDQFTPATGADLQLTLESAAQVGAAGGWAAASWLEAEVAWFFLRAPGMQRNGAGKDGGEAVKPDAKGSVNIEALPDGVCMVGVDWSERIEEWDAATLRGFIETAGGKAAGDDGGKVRVARRESAKLLIRAVDPAGPPPGSESTANSKAGQQAEIRPLMDPTVAGVGGDIGLRIYASGDAAKRGVVVAIDPQGNIEQRVQTDEKGIGYLRLTRPGLWRLEFNHVVPLNEPGGPEWQVWTATLTFEAPAPIEGGAK